MFTVSLHGIRLRAFVGLYPEEKISGNDLEIDVDMSVTAGIADELPFMDYALIHEVVTDAFKEPGELLETFVKQIHAILKSRFPQADKIKVAIRKLQPPLTGSIKYAQVSWEA